MILCYVNRKVHWIYKHIITDIKFTKAPDVDDKICTKCNYQYIGHPMTPLDENTYEKLCTLEVMQHELFDYNKLEFFKLRKKDLI